MAGAVRLGVAHADVTNDHPHHHATGAICGGLCRQPRLVADG
jgi:hypothetical protein